MFLLRPYEEMSPHFKLHIETFSYYVIWLLKIDPKNVEAIGWYCYSIPVFDTDKQSFVVKYK